MKGMIIMIKGYLGDLKWFSKFINGTTKSDMKITPDKSVATNGIDRHKLITVGDEEGTNAYGMADPTKPTTGIMATFGREAIATGTQTDTGADVRIINKLVNTGVNKIQGLYVKAKNYATGTVGSIVGLFVEVVSDGTVTNGAIGIEIGSDNTVLEQDIKFANGLGFFASALAITAGSTATTLPAGSVGITSNATGRGKLFVSDGSKWQYMGVA